MKVLTEIRSEVPTATVTKTRSFRTVANGSRLKVNRTLCRREEIGDDVGGVGNKLVSGAIKHIVWQHRAIVQNFAVPEFIRIQYF